MKREFFWAFRRMADGQVEATKICGHPNADGSYFARRVEKLRNNITTIHEYRLQQVLACPDPSGRPIDLPLVLAFTRESGYNQGADLHLYHCALIPASVCEVIQRELF